MKQKDTLVQIRNLITEIGNALGLVRMVRSSVMNHSKKVLEYVPTQTDASALPPSLGNHVRFLESKIPSNEKKEDFKVLVQVFQEALKKEDHLRSFYMLIPVLSFSHIESILVAKHQVGRAHKGGFTTAFFTNDGFAMGLAYLLQIFKQDASFDQLHWFRAVHQHFREDAPQEDVVLKGRAKEYELLKFAFSGARIFFK